MSDLLVALDTQRAAHVARMERHMGQLREDFSRSRAYEARNCHRASMARIVAAERRFQADVAQAVVKAHALLAQSGQRYLELREQFVRDGL